MAEKYVKESRFLSYVLRHKPGAIGLSMDNEGWVEVDQLVRMAKANEVNLCHDVLSEIVESDNKDRYEYSEDGKQIRARQGHSIVGLDLGFQEALAPDLLYHGTATKYLESIQRNGIVKGHRHHVHLSDNIYTAVSVGRRHGEPVCIAVNARQMQADGLKFYRSNNGVWLTYVVDPQYFMDILTTIKKDTNA